MPMGEQGANDAGVGDDYCLRHIQVSDKIKRPALQAEWRFATGWSIASHIRSPGVELCTRDVVPGLTFPNAKIHLGQPLVK